MATIMWPTGQTGKADYANPTLNGKFQLIEGDTAVEITELYSTGGRTNGLGVRAVQAGTVVLVDDAHAIWVQHSGYVARYGFAVAPRNAVKKGDKVKCGDVLGYTRFLTSPSFRSEKIHFSIMPGTFGSPSWDYERVQPLTYLKNKSGWAS